MKRRRPEPQPCPTPHKIGHRRQQDAHGAARIMARELNARGKYFAPAFSYLCVCGSFHLTRWDRGPDGTPNRPEWSVPRMLQEFAMERPEASA